MLLITPAILTCPLYTNSGCGKERCILFGPWGPAKAEPLLALCQQTLGSERHRYAIA